MTDQTLSRLYHCVYKLDYHLALITKYRRKCMTRIMLERLGILCRYVAAKWECGGVEPNGISPYSADVMGCRAGLAPPTMLRIPRAPRQGCRQSSAAFPLRGGTGSGRDRNDLRRPAARPYFATRPML